MGKKRHPVKDELWREQINGIRDSGNYLQGMKRRGRELSWSCATSK